MDGVAATSVSWGRLRPGPRIVPTQRDAEHDQVTAGRLVRLMRARGGITQQRLAVQAGYSAATVSRLERGLRVKPSAGALICRALSEILTARAA
jgi:DNA-binding XRE family transcriptional regulator